MDDDPDPEKVEVPCIGERFPHIKVRTTQGEIELPDHYNGKWLVLFSHPADFTPVCTTEFVSFAKNMEKFKSMNCELLGSSIDQVYSHIKWLEWIEEKLNVKIEYPIVADSSGKLASLLGSMQPPSKSVAIRALFVIDPVGAIRSILYYPKGVGRNINEILRLLKAMQIADQYHVAIPVNWPDNEIIGDDVLVPPANNIKDAMALKNDDRCFDWWFCHKKVDY